MRAATAKPLAKEHFGQVGEYQLQDAFLSDPFQVNLALVQNAYSCFARITGCRPGMAVHTRHDEADPDAFWYDAAPLQNKDLTISVEHQLLEIEGMGKLVTMEVQFRRKKGEYFSTYNWDYDNRCKPSTVNCTGYPRARRLDSGATLG